MKLTKNKGMYFTAIFIILAVYNVIAFVIPFNREGTFWVGYGFSMFALLLTAIVIFNVFDKPSYKSKFYGIPLISLVWIYLIIQLIVGLLQMIMDFIPIQYMIMLNTILLGVCLVGLLAVKATKDEIERIDEEIKEKVFYIKSLQVDVEGLVNKASDDMKKILKDLAETIRYSDPMSSSQLAAIENKIEVKTSVLTEAVEKADNDTIKTLCNELQQLFAERNRKCKMLK